MTNEFPIAAYIGLGSNLGNRKNRLLTALEMLAETEGICLEERSPLLETEPEGPGTTDHPAYINAVAHVRTRLDPDPLVKRLETIERQMGRTGKGDVRPRVIDLDLLFYGDRVIDREGLTVPHPDVHRRRFVLDPLARIAPNLIHPTKEKSIQDLLDSLTTGRIIGETPT